MALRMMTLSLLDSMYSWISLSDRVFWLYWVSSSSSMCRVSCGVWIRYVRTRYGTTLSERLSRLEGAAVGMALELTAGLKVTFAGTRNLALAGGGDSLRCVVMKISDPPFGGLGSVVAPGEHSSGGLTIISGAIFPFDCARDDDDEMSFPPFAPLSFIASFVAFAALVSLPSPPSSVSLLCVIAFGLGLDIMFVAPCASCPRHFDCRWRL